MPGTFDLKVEQRYPPVPPGFLKRAGFFSPGDPLMVTLKGFPLPLLDLLSVPLTGALRVIVLHRLLILTFRQCWR
ncbi:MAG: hypothetical protein SNJ69_13685 [Chloroflexaceae bacterium]